MKVLKMQVHHVGCIGDVDFELAGHNLYLVGGRNGHGKTVAIKSLLMALCGRKELGDQWPSRPLKDDEEEGWIKVFLSGDEELQDDLGFVAELHFTRKRDGGIREEFVLRDSDGDPAPEPRTILKNLYKMNTFDPTGFERLKPAQQRAELCRMFPEIDTSETDKQIKSLFDKRTEVNRDGKNAKARFDAMPEHKGVPDEEVVVEELFAELKKRQAVNKANDNARSELAGMDTLIKDTDEWIDTIEQTITALTKQLKLAKADYRKLLTDKSLSVNARNMSRLTVDALQDADTEEVERQIAESQTVNARVRSNAERRKLKIELDNMRAESQALTDEMKALEDAKVKALREAKLPVPGLAVDGEGILYDGRPFEDANTKTRFLVGCMIGMAGEEPKLPLLVCEHGSNLDWEAFQELDAMLKEKGWQAIIEVATRTPYDDEQCQVVLSNGEAVSHVEET